MKKNLLYIPSALLILSSCSGLYLNKANKKFDEEAYAVAAGYYERSFEKKESDEAIAKAVDSYLAIANYQAAEEWLKKAIGMQDASPMYSLKLAQVLVMNGKCDEGEAMYKKYLEANPVAADDGRMIGSCEVPMAYNPDSTVYAVEATSVNTRQSNFGANYYENGIVFTSQRYSEDAKIEEKTNMPYMDLYYAEIDDSGELGTPKAMSGLNGKYHEGIATFGAEGNLVVYAASQLKESGKSLEKTENSNFITLMTADKVNGEWMNHRQVFAGTPSYSMSHPFLADNGKTLYFSSDKPGGMGGIDIYKSTFADGAWSEPVNLEQLNTAGDDEFPFVWSNGSESRMYYASNGIEGTLGGLDIYYMVIKGSKFDGPYHMTAPINSSRDDFNLILSKDLRTGFLSSNRYDGKGVDYLYKVDIVDPEFVIECTVLDSINDEVIANANVEVVNKVTGDVKTYTTNDEGVFTYVASMETGYGLDASAADYVGKSSFVSTEGRKLSATIKKSIPLQSLVAQGISRWEHIYYDYDRSTIRKESKITMDTIVAIMNRFPDVRIELSGYADVRGDFMYNIELSKKRADKARDYLISKGIAPERVESQGLGETKILNKCVEGVECTNEEHQINRRTEFRAIK